MVYGEAIIDRLHENCALRNEDNPARKVLINTIGEILERFDLYGSMEAPYLQNATGVYLDLQGKDLGVLRKFEESDDDYRRRLYYEVLAYLTIDYLVNVYNLDIYTYVEGFNFESNMLVSDNPYIKGKYMCQTTDEIQSILNKKFIIDGGLFWLDNGGKYDYIMIGDVNHITQFMDIYFTDNISDYFRDNTLIESVRLKLPNAKKCIYLFRGCTGLTSFDLSLPNAKDCTALFRECTGLTSVDLSLPNVDNCNGLFRNCTGLTDVVLYVPKLVVYINIFNNCSNLETIDVTIPSSRVTNFKTYVLGLDLPNLTSFIINGEEMLE